MVTSTTLDPGTASAIRQALEAASGGRIGEARRIGEKALASGGDAAALNAMLGSFCLASGDFEGAIPHLRGAQSQRPDDMIIALNLGTALTQLGRYQEALDAVPTQLALKDRTLKLQRLRGFCSQELEDYPSAIEAYERVLASDPTDWESWNNLGNSRRCNGEFEGAVEALRRAASLAADAPPVRLNFANALLAVGKASEGEAELKAMASDFPDDWRSLRELYIHLRSLAREEEALKAIEEASSRNPEDLELLLAVASQRLLLLDDVGAESAYREVVARDPRNISGNLGLAVVYELFNRVEDLSALVAEAEGREVDEQTVNFIRAFNHRRAKRFTEGLAVMAAVSDEIESSRHAQLLGQLHDGAGHYDEAWSAFSRMNEIQLDLPSHPVERASAFRQQIRQNFKATTPEWVERWRAVKFEDSRESPVFLVGFPRSGTTILDTILMGHSQVEVLEEEPTLRRVGQVFADYEHLPDAPEEAIKSARNCYFEDAAQRTPMAPGKLIIDKNPLSMLALPFIHRILPDAKVILALRHPCDIVLSCFTTNFKLNDGMSNFLRLDTTAELFDLGFSYFEQALKLLQMTAHTVKYENIVADRERELKSLLEFLGLEWDERVLDHMTVARDRGAIKTASYSQVTEPIYSRSTGRWRHYRHHLEPILPVLKPWIEKFGYEI